MSHPSARLTAHGRLLLCRRIEGEGWRVRESAGAAGFSRQAASKWLGHWRAEGRGGLLDRPSRPRRIASRVVGPSLRRVVPLRLSERRGPAWIAWDAGLALATVYRALRRHRLQRLRALEPREPEVRYCWPHVGDQLHLDRSDRSICPGALLGGAQRAAQGPDEGGGAPGEAAPQPGELITQPGEFRALPGSKSWIM